MFFFNALKHVDIGYSPSPFSESPELAEISKGAFVPTDVPLKPWIASGGEWHQRFCWTPATWRGEPLLQAATIAGKSWPILLCSWYSIPLENWLNIYRSWGSTNIYQVINLYQKQSNHVVKLFSKNKPGWQTQERRTETHGNSQRM